MEHKSYYAVIPANVRYDKDLSANAKLLYGEITALCHEKGYCWATNQYFADLYGVSTKSISRWVGQLVDKKYLHLKLIYKDGTKEIQQRRLYLFPPMDNDDQGYRQKCPEGSDKNVQDNNTVNNKNNNTIKEIRHKYGQYKNVLLSDKDLEKLHKDYGKPIIDEYITKMDEWIELNGKRYKNYNLALRKWLKNAKIEPSNNIDKKEGNNTYDEEYFMKLMEQQLKGNKE
ncbi:MAG: helix-turn-helix domain-containing protein [Romboutsia timonensis]